MAKCIGKAGQRSKRVAKKIRLTAVKKTQRQWATEISALYRETVRRTVEGVFAIGLKLIAARGELDHGEFLKMIERELPFGASSAQRYMKIYRTPRLRKAARVQSLPAAVGVLYELTKPSDQEFDDAVAQGKVHPGMTRSDAIGIARRAESGERPKQYHTVQVVTKAKRYTSVAYVKPAKVIRLDDPEARVWPPFPQPARLTSEPESADGESADGLEFKFDRFLQSMAEIAATTPPTPAEFVCAVRADLVPDQLTSSYLRKVAAMLVAFADAVATIEEGTTIDAASDGGTA